MVERDVIGGGANLWDCIPSKAMIATGGVISLTQRARDMGLACSSAGLDLGALRQRIASITGHLESSWSNLLASQGVRVIRGAATMKGPHKVWAKSFKGGGVRLVAT